MEAIPESRRAKVRHVLDVGKTLLYLWLLMWAWFPASLFTAWCLSIALPLKYLDAAMVLVNRAFRGRWYGGRRTVLLTGGHRPEGLHLARVLRREGFYVIAVTPRCFLTSLCFYSTCVDQLIQVPCPRKDSYRYSRELVRIAVENRVDFFLPATTPKEVEAEAAAARSLARVGVTSLVASAATIPDFLRLDRFYLLVESMNMETVMYYTVKDMTRVAGLYRRGVIVVNGCRFMAKMAAPNGLPDSKWLPLPRSLQDAQRQYGGLIGDDGETWVVAKFTSGHQYLLTVLVRKNRVIACLSCREGRTLHMVRCREMEQWAHVFFHRLSFEVSGIFTFRFLKTIPEGRRTTFLPVHCKPCGDLSLLFLDGRMGALSLLTSPVDPAAADQLGAAVDVQTHETRPLCVYSLYRRLMRIVLFSIQLKVTSVSWEILRTVRMLLQGKEVTLCLCDPIPFLLWNHVIIPWRLAIGLLQGATVEQLHFISGRMRHSPEDSSSFADEPGGFDDDVM